MSQATLICDLFDWLPSWGEFDLRQYWRDREFVIEVDYEVEPPVAGEPTIRTKVLRFLRPTTVIVSTWPTAATLHPAPMAGVETDRGQLWDVGMTALLTDVRATLELFHGRPFSDLRHYCVHFEDMEKTFQVVATSVEVGDP